MNKLKALLNKKKSLHQDTVQNEMQNKRASLVMGVLKALTVPIANLYVRASRTSDNEQDTYSIINEMAGQFFIQLHENQKLIIETAVNQCGQVGSEEHYVWRRALNVAAAFESKPVNLQWHDIVTALLGNDDDSKMMQKRLTGSISSLADTLKLGLKYNRYNNKGNEKSFFSSDTASTFFATSKIHRSMQKWDLRELNKHELLIDVVEIMQQVRRRLLEHHSQIANNRQREMLNKACLTHSSTIVAAALDCAGHKHAYKVSLSQNYEKVIIDLQANSNHIADLVMACHQKMVDVIWTMEDQHVTLESGFESRTGLELSEYLQALEQLAKWRIPDDSFDNTMAQDISTQLSQCIELTQYLTNCIDENLCSLESTSTHQFACNSAWECISKSLRHTQRAQICLEPKQLRGAINLACYILSEQPSDNPMLQKYGLTQRSMEETRSLRDRVVPNQAKTLLNVKKTSISLACQMTELLIKTNCFCWGLSIGYVATTMMQSVLSATQRLYIQQLEQFELNNQGVDKITVFEACLQQAASTYTHRWQQESDRTLSQSQQIYTRGAISKNEALAIISKLEACYRSEIDDLIEENNLLLQAQAISDEQATEVLTTHLRRQC